MGTIADNVEIAQLKLIDMEEILSNVTRQLADLRKKEGSISHDIGRLQEERELLAERYPRSEMESVLKDWPDIITQHTLKGFSLGVGSLRADINIRLCSLWDARTSLLNRIQHTETTRKDMERQIRRLRKSLSQFLRHAEKRLRTLAEQTN